MQESLALTTAIMLGLLGGTHCLGMCGGLAATIAIQSPKSTLGGFYLAAYNTGRITSYTLAGAFVGSLSWWLREPSIMFVLRAFAAIMLVCMGLYIAQWWQGLTKVEQGGKLVWRYIQPFASKLIPVKSLPQAFALGMLWGWLPCGLIYSTLIWASAAPHWSTSALLMLCFGLGTLPAMLLTGAFAAQLQGILRKKMTRHLSGGLIIIFGLLSFPWASVH
ncbi:MAG: sulfite exporter TauE/SafE family protein [Pontibacterium sp.]